MRAAQAEEKREALKERRKIPRQGMPMLEAATRATGFEEVALGFTAELAQREAWRCLFCKKARCVEACPVHNDIPTYLQALLDGRTDEALFGNSYPLTAICGRVCYRPCEAACPVGIKAEPVAIAALERFAADRFYALHGHGRAALAADPVADPPAEVAVIGAGPAGLMCAYQLAWRGWQVTVFEQHPVPGGLLWLGIPEYRLPREVIQQEVATLTALGVRLRLGARFGGDVTIESLRQEGYRAIFLGIGTHRGKRMGIPGEDAYSGVQEALTFLRAVNLGERSKPGDRVLVIGGGDSAIDAARTARRLGSQAVTIVYRRSRREMPANPGELEEAEHEGVAVECLAAPVRLLGEAGRLTGAVCQRMTLGEPDASGRPRPVPVPGSEFTIPADAVLAAIGQEPDFSCLPSDSVTALTKGKAIAADPESLATPLPGVFAGGDVVTGPRTVVEAMAAGRRAAEAIDRYLRTAA